MFVASALFLLLSTFPPVQQKTTKRFFSCQLFLSTGLPTAYYTFEARSVNVITNQTQHTEKLKIREGRNACTTRPARFGNDYYVALLKVVGASFISRAMNVSW